MAATVMRLKTAATTHPPPMLGPALPAITQPIRHFLKADTGSGTDLRNQGAAPDDHPLPARQTVEEARPWLEALSDVVLSRN